MAAYDVLGIGNAIVDVIAQSDDAFLEAEGLDKGRMELVDEARAEALYDRMGPAVEMSGGSAANTMAGIASLGGRGAYLGKVRDDTLGRVFRHDIQSAGIHFPTAAATDGAATARCLVLVTPDAQRTMCTYLGACVGFGPADVDEALVAAAKVTYLEGYLWDPPDAKRAFIKAATAAHSAGNRVALSLSDPFCVDRHRDEFRELVQHHIDILFANEQELMSLYLARDFDTALQAVRGQCDVAVLTRSAKGSVVLDRDDVHVIDAEPIPQVVDTTGAGDLYAAGFLYGYTNGRDAATAARIGSVAAAEVIQHYGARPAVPLARLLAENRL